MGWGVGLGIWFDPTLSRAGVDITEKVNAEPSLQCQEPIDCCVPFSQTVLEGKDEGQERVLLPTSLGDSKHLGHVEYKRGRNSGRADPQFLQGEGLL